MSLVSETTGPLSGRREALVGRSWSGMKSRKRTADALVYVVLTGVGLSMIFPLFWMVSTSLRTEPELYILPPPLLPIHWTWDNVRVQADA